ncbi:hypothetical protein JCM11251_005489 [Rhodosporidiobolus azoricus]
MRTASRSITPLEPLPFKRSMSSASLSPSPSLCPKRVNDHDTISQTSKRWGRRGCSLDGRDSGRDEIGKGSNLRPMPSCLCSQAALPPLILAFLAFFLLLILAPNSSSVNEHLQLAKEAVKSRFRPVEEVAGPLRMVGDDAESWSSGGEAHGMGDVCATEHGCRFLVPTTIGEQSSRAHFHLLQLSSLATTLNRTLVLPRAYSSRFSTCGDHAFDYFYNITSFASSTSSLVGSGAVSITQREFERWLANRPGSTGAYAVRLAIPMSSGGDPETADSSYGRLIPDQAPYGGKELMPCLDEEKLDFRGREPVVRYEPWRFYGQKLVEDLKVLDEQEPQARVLLLHYNLRGPFFSRVEREALTSGAIEKAFEYRDEWEELAEMMADLPELRGKEVVGVHWRTEKLEAERLRECGESLHGVLERMREITPPAAAVYLASDFPVESLEGAPSRLANSSNMGTSGEEVLAHSDTLSELLTPAHSAAISSFLQSFSSSATTSPPADLSHDLTLHTFSSLLPSLLKFIRSFPSSRRTRQLLSLALSPAAASILDLLVLRRVEFFISGFSAPYGISTEEALKRWETEQGRGVCGKRSNWTARVVRGRKRHFDAQKVKEDGKGRRLSNVAGTWSVEGKVDGLTEGQDKVAE